MNIESHKAKNRFRLPWTENISPTCDKSFPHHDHFFIVRLWSKASSMRITTSKSHLDLLSQVVETRYSKPTAFSNDLFTTVYQLHREPQRRPNATPSLIVPHGYVLHASCMMLPRLTHVSQPLGLVVLAVRHFGHLLRFPPPRKGVR